MTFNLLFIFIIICAIGGYFYRNFKALKSTDETDYFEESDSISLEYLKKEIQETINDMLRENLDEQNLTREQKQLKDKRNSMLRSSITDAQDGDINAKRYLINIIIYILKKEKYGLNRETVNKVIPFDHLSSLTSVDCFQILFHEYAKRYELIDVIDAMFQDAGFPSKYTVDDILPGDEQYYDEGECTIQSQEHKVTEEEMVDFYRQKYKEGFIDLDITDCIEIIAQRIYEGLWGDGVIDLVNSSGIDEIDCGVSGIPDRNNNLSITETERPASWKSIWIMYHGMNVYMKCLYFSSQADFVRVCEKIYRYDPPYVLSKDEGKIVASRKDGSRIAVARPDFADSYAFWLRKFDDKDILQPYGWVSDKNAFIPVHTAKWMIRGLETVMICGSMGVGKTMLAKAFMGFVPPINIRIQELRAELNLRYVFPEKNIVAFQETDKLDSQAAIDFSKKTHGLYSVTGEAAEAKQIAGMVQNKGVAYKGSIATHHANSHEQLIEISALNLLQEGIYSNKHDAIYAAAKTFTICIHLSMDQRSGHRYIDCISECIPVEDRPYPSNMDKAGLSSKEAFLVDAVEYTHRMTNPVQYEIHKLVIFNTENSTYEFAGEPSESLMNTICSNITEKEERMFRKDLSIMQQLTEEARFAG